MHILIFRHPIAISKVEIAGSTDEVFRMGPILVSRALGSKMNQKMLCDSQNKISTSVMDGLIKHSQCNKEHCIGPDVASKNLHVLKVGFFFPKTVEIEYAPILCAAVEREWREDEIFKGEPGLEGELCKGGRLSLVPAADGADLA